MLCISVDMVTSRAHDHDIVVMTSRMTSRWSTYDPIMGSYVVPTEGHHGPLHLYTGERASMWPQGEYVHTLHVVHMLHMRALMSR